MGYGQFSSRTAPYNGQSGRKGSKRKTVYPTDRIAHLWAHKTQDYAKNGGQNNFYFDGDTIFSYGSHFPIARHVSYRGTSFVFLTSRTYSVTTAGHISLVRHAIPPSLKVFHVFDPTCTVQEALKEYVADITKHRAELAKSKNVAQRVKLYRALEFAVLNINCFAAYLGFKRRWRTGLNAAEIKLLNAACKRFDESAQKRREAAARAAETRQANQRARWAQQNAVWQQQNAERLERETQEAIEWAEQQEEKIAAWREGQDSIPWRFLQSLPAMLRIVGDTVQTSHGAEFPVAHALCILPIVEKLLETGRVYQRNGHNLILGGYVLDSIDEHGTIRAGCHVVEKQEVVRLIEALKALPQSAAQSGSNQ